MTTTLPPLGAVVEFTDAARPIPGTVVGYGTHMLSPLLERSQGGQSAADLLPQTLVLVEVHEPFMLGDTGLQANVVPLHPDFLTVLSFPRLSYHLTHTPKDKDAAR